MCFRKRHNNKMQMDAGALQGADEKAQNSQHADAASSTASEQVKAEASVECVLELQRQQKEMLQQLLGLQKQVSLLWGALQGDAPAPSAQQTGLNAIQSAEPDKDDFLQVAQRAKEMFEKV